MKTTVKFDYKEPEVLAKYLDSQGRIKPRKETKLTKEQQRQLSKHVKRARYLALLP